jgi:hypothetical protein
MVYTPEDSDYKYCTREVDKMKDLKPAPVKKRGRLRKSCPWTE